MKHHVRRSREGGRGGSGRASERDRESWYATTVVRSMLRFPETCRTAQSALIADWSMCFKMTVPVLSHK